MMTNKISQGNIEKIGNLSPNAVTDRKKSFYLAEGIYD